jgi:hypothetical protein
MNPLSIWREVPARHRRWLFWNAVVVAAIINFILNGAIAWLSVRSEDTVPLWAVPLVDEPSTITDTIGTFFVLPFLTTLVITTVAWHELAAGRLPPLGSVSRTLLGRLPPTRLRRGLVIGAVCMVVLGPLAALVLVALDFGDLSVGEFVLYKAIFGVVFGALVTPPIAIAALADSRVAAEAP